VGADTIQEKAFAVWQVMNAEAMRHGLALSRYKVRGVNDNGRVVIGTIASYIYTLDRARGWELTKGQVQTIREFLRESGNVVVLEKVSTQERKFRIFIREEWNDAVAVPIGYSGNGGTYKRESEEPVEHYPIDEVQTTYVCSYEGCDKRFASLAGKTLHQNSHERLTNKQKTVFECLVEDFDGSITNSSGLAATPLMDKLKMGKVSDELNKLEAAGFLTKDTRGRRTYTINVTDKGFKAYEELFGKSKPESSKINIAIQGQPGVGATMLAPEPEHVPTTEEREQVVLQDISDNELLQEIMHRLENNENEKEKDSTLELIASLVDDVEQGNTSALRALADIKDLL